ncbi:MAG: hypothetical protein HC771_22000 [Synechococcales cyanobacterium CRU_2_2]|nr:hypothetical protein [Synechococcales cyanobacterium CRU_2_2]
MAFGDSLRETNSPLVTPTATLPAAEPEYISIAPYLGAPAPECPVVEWGGDCEPALSWLEAAAVHLGWLGITAIRGSPGRWRYEIVPATELAARAKGRTWPQLMDRLVKPKDFAAIAKSFQQKLESLAQEDCEF